MITPDVQLKLQIELKARNFEVYAFFDNTVDSTVYRLHGSEKMDVSLPFFVKRKEYMGIPANSNHVIGLCVWIYLEYKPGVMKPLDPINFLITRKYLEKTVKMVGAQTKKEFQCEVDGTIKYAITATEKVIGKLRPIDDETNNSSIMSKKISQIRNFNTGKIYIDESVDLDRHTPMASHFIRPLAMTENTKKVFIDSEKHVRKLLKDHGVTFDAKYHWIEVINAVNMLCMKYTDDNGYSSDRYYPPYFSNTGDCEDFALFLPYFKKLFSLMNTELSREADKYEMGVTTCHIMPNSGKQMIGHLCCATWPAGAIEKKDYRGFLAVESTEICLLHPGGEGFKEFSASVLGRKCPRKGKQVTENFDNKRPFFYRKFYQLYHEDKQYNFMDGLIQGITYDQLITGKFTLQEVPVMDPVYRELAIHDSRFKPLPECCYSQLVETSVQRTLPKEEKSKGTPIFICYYTEIDLMNEEIVKDMNSLKEKFNVKLKAKTIGGIYGFYKLSVYPK